MREFKSRDGSITFVRDAGPSECWVFRDADDYRAGHRGVLLVSGEDEVAYEVAGWRPQSAVDGVLAAAGFTGGDLVCPHVVEIPDDAPIVKLKGFVVPEGRGGELQMMLRRDLSGRLGGWHPVVMSQVGFHRAPWLFDYLWRAMGCPPVRVRHPDLVPGHHATTAGPTRISPAADVSATLRALRALQSED